MSDWIEWKGGKCPVDTGCIVTVKFKNGVTNPPVNAETLAWYHIDKDNKWNIVAYKVEEIKEKDVDKTLDERGERYGDFIGHAKITQGIKRVMHSSPKWDSLSDDKKEALEMTAHKIGRILNGDPEYHDSWHDIIGYNKLIERTLKCQ